MAPRTGPRSWIGWALLAVGDVLAVAAGMGVPIFAIVWGAVAGWYAARTSGLLLGREPQRFRRAFAGAAGLAGLTLGMMLAIWGPQVGKLTEPGFDAGQYGIPLVLYTSTASFIGWLVLMIVLAPILQLMCSMCVLSVVAMRPVTAVPSRATPAGPVPSGASPAPPVT